VSGQLRAPRIIVAITVALVAGACSGTPAPVPDEGEGAPGLADEMISGELATAVGLGPLTSDCHPPAALAIDTMFDCTATTEAGQLIQIRGSVDPGGKLALTTTNLITAEAIPSFEREVAAMLNDSVGSNFTAESIDCGTQPVILPPDLVMGCALTMPASGEVFDVTLAITDLDERHFSLQVAEQPRSALVPDPADPTDGGGEAGGE
jgi:hypothetical protein